METATTTIMVPGPDGRELCVESGGDPHGRAVLVHDGTPNSRHLYPPLLADAERDGIRLLSYDRPGYGRSTAQPGRSVADCANDVRAIASALGIHRMGVWGISGGGPTRWPVLRCCPTSSARWARWRRSPPTGSRASTSSAAWARTTSTTSPCSCPTRSPPGRSPGRTETSSWRSRPNSWRRAGRHCSPAPIWRRSTTTSPSTWSAR